MYKEYFGLKEEPFSIAPDPHYIYMSRGHREALAHLLYGIERDGGFVLLTGEVGTGKTTVCRCLLEEIPETTEIAFILNPKMTVEELLASICDEFRIAYPENNTSVKVFVSRINEYLLDVHSKGRRAVLIIEEAQNLSTEVLEQIRLLTNLETNQRKLLQIIMVGQPEINEKLAQPQLRQLSQRITARYHLRPLSRKDVDSYVRYRLVIAGSARGDVFPPPVLKTLYSLTSGVPRLINVICDRALLGAYVQGKNRVDVKTLKTAAREVSGRKIPQPQLRRVAAAILLLACVLGTGYYLHGSGLLRRSAIPVSAGGSVPKAATENAQTSPLDRIDYADPRALEKAFQALFAEWRLSYKPGDGRTACDQARQQGVLCVQRTGSITELKQMNKPAVLKLRGPDGGEYFLTLIALRGDSADIRINNERVSVPVTEVSKRWSGEYQLLWQPPPEYRNDLIPGQTGALVAWVERRLAQAQKRPPRSGRVIRYDGEMVREIKEFQEASGLTPDGIIGPCTILRLSALDVREPVLDDQKQR